MDMSLSIQVRLARSIIPLVKVCENMPDQLKNLYQLCETINESVDDDHSYLYDLMEYIQECQYVAEGKADSQWRDQLLQALNDDVKQQENILSE